MANVELNLQEFQNVKNLLLNEGIKFTYKVVKGVVIITVPYFFVSKYGF